MITQTNFAILGGIIFAVGLAGICIRRDVPGLAVSLLILFTGPAVEFFGFAHTGLGGDAPPQGDVAALAVLCVMATIFMVVFGTGLILWRRFSSINSDDFEAKAE